MFIPYLGEKSKLSNFILPNIPTDISTYIEPFGGSFAVFFSLDISQYKEVQFVYNDMNDLNSNLFRHITDRNFIKHLDIIPTEDQYYNIKKNINDNNWSDLEKAINWLIVLCCSFSQYDILNTRWKDRSGFEIFKMKLASNKSLNKISVIDNKDYKEIIERYDSSESFFYLDPPYVKKESYYLNHNFLTMDNHIELSNCLKNIKGRFVLSYLDFPDIYDWYDGYNFKSHQTFMGREMLITNF